MSHEMSLADVFGLLNKTSGSRWIPEGASEFRETAIDSGATLSSGASWPSGQDKEPYFDLSEPYVCEPGRVS